MIKHQRPLATLLLCALSSTAFASPRCDQDTTQGSWVYTCEGTLPASAQTSPPPAQINSRILGRCTANRTGYFSCEGTVNVGGTILSQTLNGQANTRQNCTGRIIYTQTIAGFAADPLDIQYVISEKGDAINGLPTNSRGVLSCRLARIGNGGD